MNSNDGAQKPMTADQRLALIYAPFPVIRCTTTRGNSQAPNWVADATRQQEEGR